MLQSLAMTDADRIDSPYGGEKAGYVKIAQEKEGIG